MTDRAKPAVRDALLSETKALSNGAGTVYSTGFDLGALNARDARLEDFELEIVGPAHTTTQLPDSETQTYKVQMATDAAFTSPVTLYDAVLVQTGAGGAGAALASARYRVPHDCLRYVRIAATKTGTGDCSTISLTHRALF